MLVRNIQNENSIFKKYSSQQRPVFKGGVSSFASNMGKAADTYVATPVANAFTKLAKTSKMQKFIDWMTKKDPIRHLSAAMGIWLSSFYIYNTAKSKKIKKEDKFPLMTNMAVVTAISTISAYTLDSFLKKKINTFKDVFKTANANISKPVLDKSIKGIGAAASILIFAFMYRFFAPVIATPIANKISNAITGKNDVKKA